MVSGGGVGNKHGDGLAAVPRSKPPESGAKEKIRRKKIRPTLPETKQALADSFVLSCVGGRRPLLTNRRRVATPCVVIRDKTRPQRT
jgi:hypothetical protein